MNTKIVKVNPVNPERAVIAEAARIIREEGIVAFPTETVYGLGGDARSERACNAIYSAKGRESDNPLIIHIASIGQLEGMVKELDGELMKVLGLFWPGPVTFVFKMDPSFPKFASKHLDTVAVRMPAHPVALELIRASGCAIAAPSANISGRPSPTTAEDVIEELNGKVEMILDGGETAFGIESTVIDVSSRPFTLLRPGSFTLEELSSHLGDIIIKGGKDENAPKSPGMKYRHYAPSKKLVMASADTIKEISKAKDNRIAILCSDELAGSIDKDSIIITMGSTQSLYSIAKSLFGSFRKLEKSGAQIGVIEEFPEGGIGLAIMNRISKASNGIKISNASDINNML